MYVHGALAKFHCKAMGRFNLNPRQFPLKDFRGMLRSESANLVEFSDQNNPENSFYVVGYVYI